MDDKILRLYESLADDIGKNEEIADEFLQENNIDINKIFHEKMGSVLSLIRDFKNSKGKENQSYLQSKLETFKSRIDGLSQAMIFEMFPPISKTAFSKLSEDDISEDDINKLLEDSSFISFLEEME